MNWEAIGAVGEILGATAVVVTLAYLAGQVRIARSAAADTNRLTRASGVRQHHLAVVTNDALLETVSASYGEELVRYYERLGEAFSLSSKEAARLEFSNQYWFWLHWGQFASANDPKDLDELAHLIKGFYVLPAVRYCWDHSPIGKPLLDPDFVAFVDRALAGGPGETA